MTANRLAGFATRAVALIIDLAIIDVAALALGAALGWAAGVIGVDGTASTTAVVGLAASGWLALISAYLVAFWCLTGQTPGMRFMGIRVTDLRGVTPGFGRSLRRMAGMYLAAIPLGAGFLLVLIDDRRRGLHDRVAATLVIHDPEWGRGRRASRLHSSSSPSSRAQATASEREHTSSLR